MLLVHSPFSCVLTVSWLTASQVASLTWGSFYFSWPISQNICWLDTTTIDGYVHMHRIFRVSPYSQRDNIPTKPITCPLKWISHECSCWHAAVINAPFITSVILRLYIKIGFRKRQENSFLTVVDSLDRANAASLFYSFKHLLEKVRVAIFAHI